jgi:hypothetical protein
MQENKNLVITEILSVNSINFAGIHKIYFDSQQQQGTVSVPVGSGIVSEHTNVCLVPCPPGAVASLSVTLRYVYCITKFVFFFCCTTAQIGPRPHYC